MGLLLLVVCFFVLDGLCFVVLGLLNVDFVCVLFCGFVLLVWFGKRGLFIDFSLVLTWVLYFKLLVG